MNSEEQQAKLRELICILFKVNNNEFFGSNDLKSSSNTENINEKFLIELKKAVGNGFDIKTKLIIHDTDSSEFEKFGSVIFVMRIQY